MPGMPVAAYPPLHPKEVAMPDDPNRTGLDRKLIALTEAHQVRSWCKSLGCTEDQLRKAAAASAISPTWCASK